MKTFNQINETGDLLGISAHKCSDFQPSCPDVAPKYELRFHGTRAADVLHQNSYVSFDMKGLNEDFNEVWNLCFEPECTCDFNPSVDKKQDLIRASEDCPLHS